MPAMNVRAALLFSISLLASSLQAAPPRAKSFTLDAPLDCSDPSIIELPAHGGYMIFATGGGIPIWTSKDLHAWNRVGRVFEGAIPARAQAAVPNAHGVWAPDISLFQGRYLLYYAVSTFGSQRSVIGLAVNRTLNPADPAYRWEDGGLVLESAPGKTDFNAIDPAFVTDRKGSPYLFWGSFWSGIKAAPLDPASGHLKSGGKITPIARRAPGVNPPAIEAPYIVWKDGFYYLFVSWDFTAGGAKSDYKVAVGRSRELLGPYVDAAGRPMLEGGGSLVVTGYGNWRGPGHNSVLRTKEGDWLVHHAIHADAEFRGRALQIRPLFWLDGWPVAGAPLTAPPSARPPAAAAAAPVVGTWQHQADAGAPMTIELAAGGALRGGVDGATWTLRGNHIVLRWPDARAPQGAWEDEVVLSSDGREYVGRSRAGALIRGWR